MQTNNRVLVLDDDAHLRDAYRHILAPQPASAHVSDHLLDFLAEGEVAPRPAEEECDLLTHFDVTAVAQGLEGVEAVRQAVQEGRPYAVAFVDIRMPPGIDGLEAASRIRQEDPSIYIIIVTAYSDRSIEEIQRQLRHDVVLGRKPLSKEEIFQMARNACVSWQRDRELAESRDSLARKHHQLQEQLEVFNKFVPRKFIHVLDPATDGGHLSLGECSERVMTVMFSDIRSFTAFSETLTPTDSFRFINSYLGHMGPIIRKHDGIIDKYLGDGIMALFEEPDNAVRTTIEMSHRLHEYNLGRGRAGYQPIAIGVGINVGRLMLGTIGESDRMDTTVIGDTVNLAARTEGLTKTYGVPVMLSAAACAALLAPDAFSTRLVDWVKVRGKRDSMAFYEIVDAWPEPQRTAREGIISLYENGVKLYHEGSIKEALQCFQDCLAACPDDVPTRLFLQRCWGMANRYSETIDLTVQTPYKVPLGKEGETS
ncbi:adenylate/guanylate cyclase [Magnetococcus marinus MC-1]|uniref:Adenylate/guanylate cyclase n=1 Tax=Magnetococcus marinus (strain ATCC BAA-1437 / JCM 17883 / MC-1) TaxID=156889 RepID=A0LC27_MAGMM|nr:adenylate/guanylate cyclase domain-containing protein [Magnetococcus marinus]ABK45520.1 adenylate/guanylate cyclase [Magnetococcus marinus MC-1]